MAVVGTTLLSNVLSHSEAERAFQPWWDTTGEFITYGLIILGKVLSICCFQNIILLYFWMYWYSYSLRYKYYHLGLVTLPTTMFSSTPLDCTICNVKHGNCQFMNNTKNFNPILNETFAPGYNAWWVKKYCTMTAVDEFTLYFPYILIIIPLTMVAIEKGFAK